MRKINIFSYNNMQAKILLLLSIIELALLVWGIIAYCQDLTKHIWILEITLSFTFSSISLLFFLKLNFVKLPDWAKKDLGK